MVFVIVHLSLQTLVCTIYLSYHHLWHVDRNLLEGVIYCIEQGLWVRELTTEMIVFLDDDPTFLRPKIIDCMLSAAPGMF